MSQEPINPYAAPQSEISVAAPSGMEEARRALLKHEASVKSIGSLYLLGGSLMLVVGLSSATFGTENHWIGIMLIAFGLLQLWVAVGLRKLKRPARIAAAVLSAIGLLGFPLGTIISGYILYLLVSEKGTRVFSDEYAQVIAATPHIKYRSSLLAILGFIVIVILILVGIAVFAGSRR